MDSIRFDPGDLRFTFGWCESCDCVFVRCPKCGNNCCNGGGGILPNGNKCDTCTLAYQYQTLFNKLGCKLCDHFARCSSLKPKSLEVTPCGDFTKIEDKN